MDAELKRLLALVEHVPAVQEQVKRLAQVVQQQHAAIVLDAAKAKLRATALDAMEAIEKTVPEELRCDTEAKLCAVLYGIFKSTTCRVVQKSPAHKQALMDNCSFLGQYVCHTLTTADGAAPPQSSPPQAAASASASSSSDSSPVQHVSLSVPTRVTVAASSEAPAAAEAAEAAPAAAASPSQARSKDSEQPEQGSAAASETDSDAGTTGGSGSGGGGGQAKRAKTGADTEPELASAREVYDTLRVYDRLKSVTITDSDAMRLRTTQSVEGVPDMVQMTTAPFNATWHLAWLRHLAVKLRAPETRVKLAKLADDFERKFPAYVVPSSAAYGMRIAKCPGTRPTCVFCLWPVEASDCCLGLGKEIVANALHAKSRPYHQYHLTCAVFLQECGVDVCFCEAFGGAVQRKCFRTM